MTEQVKPEKAACCGCGACAAVCPVGAIAMRPDAEGFLYPEIDGDRCIHCDLCRRVCGFGLPGFGAAGRAHAEAPACLAARHTGTAYRESRSGGAFSAVAEQVLAKGGVVYGAALTADFSAVQHVRVADEAALAPLKGSKYCQSETLPALGQVIEDLQAGRMVLFSGMPCQVDGLYRLLEAKRVQADTLYTCDLVCHGVPSPTVWRDAVAWAAHRYGALEAVQFRDKRMGWRAHVESYTAKGKKHFANRYTQLYCAGLITRPACAACSYCSPQHPADLTLADGWNVKAAAPEWDDNGGVSCVLVQTEKGAALLAACAALETRPVPFGYEKQPNLTRPTQPGAARADFWAKYRAGGYAAAIGSFAASLKEACKIPYNYLKNRP